MATTWDKRQAVHRMRAYIDAHLHEPITIQALARQARYSVYYASRMFKDLTGESPFAYIRQRRLAAAAHTLHGGHARVIDVALDYEFDSHEGFTRAFSRHFGVSPTSFRKTRARQEFFLPAQMSRRGEVMTNRKQDVVFVQIMERPERKLIFKPAQDATHYFEYVNELGCEVFEQLGAIEQALHEPMGLWLPETLRPDGCSTYVQGVEVASDVNVEPPDGFHTLTLPACKMLVFQGPPFEDEDFEQAIGGLWQAIEGYQPEAIGYTWDAGAGPRFQLEPVGYRGYIEGRPVRALNTDAG